MNCPHCHQPTPTVNAAAGTMAPGMTLNGLADLDLRKAKCSAHGVSFFDCEPCASAYQSRFTACAPNPGAWRSELGIPVFQEATTVGWGAVSVNTVGGSGQVAP